MKELIELFGENSCAMGCLVNGYCVCDICKYGLEKVIK